MKKSQNQTTEKVVDLTGKVELDIAGTRYAGTINLKAVEPTADAKGNVTDGKITKTIYGDNGAKVVIIDEMQEINPAVIRSYPVYGVRIDRKNKDPFYSVTYTDDAADFKPATPTDAGSWSDVYPFNAIKPCVLRLDGTVEDYLNPNNFAEWHDGQPADINDRADGDVMIEFPKVYYKFSSDERYVYVQISDSPLSYADGFTNAAFSYNGVIHDKFYIGAYKGNIDDNGLLRSLSGKMPTTSKTIGEFRDAAHKCGGGFEIMPYNKLILLQALYLIRFKSLNAQSALGMGYVDAYSDGKHPSGLTDKCGLYYGTADGNTPVKVHGLEDFWGNVYEWIDGLISKDGKLLIADGGFNDAADGYTVAGEQKGFVGGWIKSIKATNELGFLIDESGGDSDEYFCNGGYVNSEVGYVYVPQFGGYWSYGSVAGAYVLNCNDSPTNASSDIGARLCFCG